MFVDKLSGMRPFLGIGALDVVNVVAIGAWPHARMAEELGEGASSYCAVRTSAPAAARGAQDAARRARARASGMAGAQKKVSQLMREYLSLEFERELQRLTEEQGLEREGRTHKHRERQRLGEELERERLARSGDQRNVQRIQ
jgi:hypothetical protein